MGFYEYTKKRLITLPENLDKEITHWQVFYGDDFGGDEIETIKRTKANTAEAALKQVLSNHLPQNYPPPYQFAYVVGLTIHAETKPVLIHDLSMYKNKLDYTNENYESGKEDRYNENN